MASNREISSRRNDTSEDVPPEEVSWANKVNGYSDFYTGEKSSVEKVETRRESAKEMTSTYYDLVTDFYQYGWGDSFHFCQIYRMRSFQQCVVDHEYYLSDKLDLKAGMKVLVCACCYVMPASIYIKAKNHIRSTSVMPVSPKFWHPWK